MWARRSQTIRLKCLNALTQLKRLSLYGGGITDAGLKHLKGLTQLQNLFLGDTQVTDAGLSAPQRANATAGIEYYEHAGHRRWASAPQGVNAVAEVVA